MIRRCSGVGLAVAVFAASPLAAQSAAPLCGITAANIAGYHAAAAADARFKRDGRDPLRETFTAESIQAIWTFTTRKNPAYPAAVCEQVINKGGAMQIDRTPLCEAGAAACAKFAAEIASGEDGSGDGE